MPRTKGSKNRPKTNNDYATQIAEKQSEITTLFSQSLQINLRISLDGTRGGSFMRNTIIKKKAGNRSIISRVAKGKKEPQRMGLNMKLIRELFEFAEQREAIGPRQKRG